MSEEKKNILTSVSTSEELMARIEAYKASMVESTGVKISRNASIVRLIEIALEVKGF